MPKSGNFSPAFLGSLTPATTLAKGNVTVKTDDYGGFEKVGTFGTKLPTDNSQIDTVPGDIVLYQGNSISFMIYVILRTLLVCF